MSPIWKGERLFNQWLLEKSGVVICYVAILHVTETLVAPTPADHEILLGTGVESEDEAQVRVLVHGGHHHPEDQDQQTRVQSQLCHASHR